MILGADPGLSGGLALLFPATGILKIFDMPVAPNPKGKTELDMHTLARLMIPPGEPGVQHVAMLEQVHAMPKQGVSSTFRFGQSFGALQMAVIGHGYEVHYTTPQSWKKHFKLSSDKGVSRALAMRRFPAQAELFSRVKDDGRAEAALIALFAAETLKRP